MKVLYRILLHALVLGLLSGIFLTGIQQIEVVPLILEAESYEVSDQSGHSHHNNEDHEQKHESQNDDTEWLRLGYTALANFLLAVGFALLLSVLANILVARKHIFVWHTGCVMGFSGFLIFHLAPALGLPPKLPGSEAAAVEWRQAWWIFTVVATAAGLALLLLQKKLYLRLISIIFVLIPHILGAPVVQDDSSLLPVELEKRFVIVSLITNLCFWLVLGALVGVLNKKMQIKRQIFK